MCQKSEIFWRKKYMLDGRRLPSHTGGQAPTTTSSLQISPIPRRRARAAIGPTPVIIMMRGDSRRCGVGPRALVDGPILAVMLRQRRQAARWGGVSWNARRRAAAGPNRMHGHSAGESRRRQAANGLAGGRGCGRPPGLNHSDRIFSTQQGTLLVRYAQARPIGTDSGCLCRTPRFAGPGRRRRLLRRRLHVDTGRLDAGPCGFGVPGDLSPARHAS